MDSRWIPDGLGQAVTISDFQFMTYSLFIGVLHDN